MKIKILRGLLLLFSLGAASWDLSAQNARIPLLDKAHDAEVHFAYVYSSRTPSARQFTRISGGQVSMLGLSYIITAPDMQLEIRSDGTCIWTLDRAGHEAVIEDAVEAVSADLLANPVLLIRSYRDFFTCSGSGSSYRLTPRDPQSPIRQLDVKISSEQGPIEIEAAMQDGSGYLFVLTDLVFSSTVQQEKYRFDATSLGKDWIVTDLR